MTADNNAPRRWLKTDAAADHVGLSASTLRKNGATVADHGTPNPARRLFFTTRKTLTPGWRSRNARARRRCRLDDAIIFRDAAWE